MSFNRIKTVMELLSYKKYSLPLHRTGYEVSSPFLTQFTNSKEVYQILYWFAYKLNSNGIVIVDKIAIQNGKVMMMAEANLVFPLYALYYQPVPENIAVQVPYLVKKEKKDEVLDFKLSSVLLKIVKEICKEQEKIFLNEDELKKHFKNQEDIDIPMDCIDEDTFVGFDEVSLEDIKNEWEEFEENED